MRTGGVCSSLLGCTHRHGIGCLPRYHAMESLAEELSGVAGNTFGLAYTHQLYHLKRTEAPICRQQRAHWAKKLFGKIKHKDPIVTQAMELGNWVFSSNCDGQFNNSQQSLLSIYHPKKDNLSSCIPSSSNPCSVDENSSSSDISFLKTACSCNANKSLSDVSSLDDSCVSNESNSPCHFSSLNTFCDRNENSSVSDSNSCIKIKEKPLRTKCIECIEEDKKTVKELPRPSSENHLNNSQNWRLCSLKISKPTANNEIEETQSMKEYHLDCGNVSMNEKLRTPNMGKRSEHCSMSSSDRSLQSSLFITQGISCNIFDSQKQANENKSCSVEDGRCSPVSSPAKSCDSLYYTVTEESNLHDAPWFQAGIPREIALEILGKQPVGSFMVRESTSKTGCFALSLRVPRHCHLSGIAHYLIMKTNRGYKIKGFTKEFPTLTALITHHSVMPELLPCLLTLPRLNPSLTKQRSDYMVDIDEDSNCNILSNFRKILRDVTQ